MIIPNNNKEVIKRITKQSIKFNKVRNIFMILAVVLTTFMISSVFSIGFSFIKNYLVMSTRLNETTALACLNKPSNGQIESLKELNYIKNVGVEVTAGEVLDDKLKKDNIDIFVTWFDNIEWENHRIPAYSDIKGCYPTKTNEVMVSRWVLEKMGIKNPTIGTMIKITYQDKTGKYTEDFILSGIYTDYKFASNNGTILVSEDFVKNKGILGEDDGVANLSFKNTIAKEEVSELLEKDITIKSNQNFYYNFNSDKNFVEANIGTVIASMLIIVFIMISGYLLIYNIMYISINKDIKFYGLLKSLGASPKQIKKIVKGIGLKLSIIGIPIGLILSFIVSFKVVPYAMFIFTSSSNVPMPSEVSFNPAIFISAAVFSLITVLVSCIKPAKNVSKISPVEALRFNSTSPKKKNKKGIDGGKLYKLAFYNVFRDRRKAIVVFISLFMGIITFLSINTFLGSLKMENFIARYAPNDFVLENIPPVSQKFDKDFIEKIGNTNGVEDMIITNLSNVKIDFDEELFEPYLRSYTKAFIKEKDGYKNLVDSFLKNPNEFSTDIIGVDSFFVRELNKKLDKPIDIDAFERGEIALFTKPYDKEYVNNVEKCINKNFSITDVETGNKKNYTFVGFSDYMFPLTYTKEIGIPHIYVSKDEVNRLNPNPMIDSIRINVNNKQEANVKAKLKELVDEKVAIKLDIRSETMVDFEAVFGVVNVLGGGMCAILIFIGLLNFINVMITGVNTRLKELAVLESIGMTKKQVKKMLIWEGAYYAVITAVLVLSLGSGIIYIIAKVAQSIADYAVFYYPISQVVLLLSIIFVICLSVPCIVYKMVTKQTIVERLRNDE